MKTIAILMLGTFEGLEKQLGLNKNIFLEGDNGWVWEYATGLQQEGIEAIVYILSQKYNGIYQSKRHGCKVRFLPLKNWHRLTSKFLILPSRWSLTAYWKTLLEAFAWQDSLQAALREDRIDLLYVQEYWPIRFDFLIEKLDIPVIGVDQGGKESWGIKSHKRQSLPKAYKLTCQNHEELETVKSYGADAVLLPNGVDTEFYSPSPENSNSNTDKTILTVARLENKQKRTSDLIRALQYIDDDWTLEIAGKGADLELLQNLASELGLADRVCFLGFIQDKKELIRKLRECGVFALPSANEAVAYAVLEAMSCGAAVITTDLKPFRNLVINDKSGIRVPVRDPKALAQGIVQCYENRERYGREARQIVVDSYSKQKLFSQLAEIINSCPTVSYANS